MSANNFDFSSFKTLSDAVTKIYRARMDPECEKASLSAAFEAFPAEFKRRSRSLDLIRQNRSAVRRVIRQHCPGKCSAFSNCVSRAIERGPSYTGDWSVIEFVANEIASSMEAGSEAQQSQAPEANPESVEPLDRLSRKKRRAAERIRDRHDPPAPRIPGPSAAILREIIAGAKDPGVSKFMSELSGIVRRHHDVSDKSIEILFLALQDGLPVQFVCEAMSS